MRLFSCKRTPHRHFVLELANSLRDNAKLRNAFSDLIQQAFSMHQISNCMVTRETQEIAPFEPVAEGISALYLEAVETLGLKQPATLQDIWHINELFYKKYLSDAKAIHQQYGFIFERNPGNDLMSRIRWIAEKKVEHFMLHPAPIIIHVLGNNSREGSVLACLEHEEILKIVKSDPRRYQAIPAHIFMVLSSAGGKATEINPVEGFAIPALPPACVIVTDTAGVPTQGEYLIENQSSVSLQQFGAPEAIRVRIGINALANVWTLNEGEETLFLQDIPVRKTATGLFFGTSEAEINEKECRAILQRSKLPLPHFILETDSFNTGDNCRLSTKIIDEALQLHHLDMADSLISYTQKQQQGIRAATTALRQGQPFRLFFYNNPDSSAHIPYMPSRQLLVYGMNLLRELLTEQKYALKNAHFHHPLPIRKGALQAALDLITTIYNDFYDTDRQWDEIDFDSACRLFSEILWPEVERDFIPRTGDRQQAFLLNAMSPVIARVLRSDSPDEVHDTLENWLKHRMGP